MQTEWVCEINHTTSLHRKTTQSFHTQTYATSQQKNHTTFPPKKSCNLSNKKNHASSPQKNHAASPQKNYATIKKIRHLQKKSHNLSTTKIVPPQKESGNISTQKSHAPHEWVSQKKATSPPKNIRQPLLTKTRATSPHKISRNLTRQKITLPLHTKNHATSTK